MPLALFKKVGQKPETVKIEGLKDMQELVGGYIETLRVGNDIVLVCNEEGKLERLAPNFRIGNDIIVGDVFFTKGNDEGEFIDLGPEDIKAILNYLDRPSIKI